MRVLLPLTLSLLLTACGGPSLLGAERAAGGFAAAGKQGGKQQPTRKEPVKQAAKPSAALAANVALMFKIMDEDADGAIVASEWPHDSDAVSRGATPHATPDKDRDGRIDAAEWTAFGLVRFKAAPFAAAEIEAGLLRADLDASTKLTADEVGLFIGGLPAATRASLYLDDEPVSAWVKAGDRDRDFALDRTELERLLGQLMIRRFGDVG